MPLAADLRVVFYAGSRPRATMAGAGSGSAGAAAWGDGVPRERILAEGPQKRAAVVAGRAMY